jgi:hypothetical protein
MGALAFVLSTVTPNIEGMRRRRGDNRRTRAEALKAQHTGIRKSPKMFEATDTAGSVLQPPPLADTCVSFRHGLMTISKYENVRIYAAVHAFPLLALSTYGLKLPILLPHEEYTDRRQSINQD